MNNNFQNNIDTSAQNDLVDYSEFDEDQPHEIKNIYSSPDVKDIENIKDVKDIKNIKDIETEQTNHNEDSIKDSIKDSLTEAFNMSEPNLSQILNEHQKNIVTNIFSGDNLNGLADECQKLSESFTDDDIDLATTDPDKFMNKYLAKIFNNPDIKNLINNCIKKNN